MEPTTNRFYCYGDVYVNLGLDSGQNKKNQAKQSYAPNPNWGRGHCEMCNWTYSTPTNGLDGGQEWLLCAECKLETDLADKKGPFKTRLCHWFQNKGGCPQGTSCTFMHGADDKGPGHSTSSSSSLSGPQRSNSPEPSAEAANADP